MSSGCSVEEGWGRTERKETSREAAPAVQDRPRVMGAGERDRMREMALNGVQFTRDNYKQELVH